MLNNVIQKSQNNALYLLFFTFNFEAWDPFNTGIDYVIIKATIILYLLTTLINFTLFYSFKNIGKFILPLAMYFVLLTFMSYINKNSKYDEYFDVRFFLNILLLLTISNHAKKDSEVLLKGLYIFSLGTIILTIMYLLGIQTEYTLDNRITIFGYNQNELGLKLCIAMLILNSIIIGNKLELGKSRYLLYVSFPFMLKFLIETGSRVAFISLLLGISIFFLYNRQGRNFNKIFVFFSLIILSFLIWETLIKQSFIAERLLSSIKEGDLSGREIFWQAAINIIDKHLLWGQGSTGYATSIESSLGFFISPHNVVLEILCCTGIFGLSIMFIFFYQIIRSAYSAFVDYNEILCFVLIIPVLGMIISGQIFFFKIAWVIFAYIISLSFSKVTESMVP